MSHDPQKNIDYSEGGSVVEEHAAAASREKEDPVNGTEPISLWVFLLAAVFFMGGGIYFGSANGGVDLDMDRYARADYTPKPPAGLKAEAPKDWIEVWMKEGKKAYLTCSGCHLGDGVGTPQYPPLAGSEWVTGGTERLAMIILNGLVGPVKVKGKVYNEAGMQAWGTQMSDAEIAQVMTYIRRSWGNIDQLAGDDGVVTEEMVRVAREKHGNKEGNHVVADFDGIDGNLPGAKVDLVTGAPLP